MIGDWWSRALSVAFLFVHREESGWAGLPSQWERAELQRRPYFRSQLGALFLHLLHLLHPYYLYHLYCLTNDC